MKLTARIFSIVLAFVIVIGVLPISAMAAGSINYGIAFVNGDNLRLRSQPNTYSRVIDMAAKDDCVVVVSKVGSWYKVIYNKQSGYMYGSYLDVSKTQNAELGYGKVNGNQVNLRTGASTYYRSIGQVNKGQKLYILGISDGWYKVIYENSICYIRSDYMDLTEIPYENEDSTKAPLFYRHGKSTGLEPSAEALKNADWNAPTTPAPTEPKPTEPKPTEPKPTEPKPTEPEIDDSKLLHGIGFVTAQGGLRLRAKATTASAIVNTAPSNDCVVIISKTGDWYKVNYNLKEGYMHADYLRVATQENAELGYGKVIADGTGFYDTPNTNGKLVDTGDKDEKAYIIGLNHGWFKVIFGENICYVPSDRLTLTEIPYENRASENYPRFFRQGKSTGLAPSAEALNQKAPEASTDGEQIVATAKKYLGVPYVWGGASPSGFDCSGLVYYVFRCNGYSMYRTPADQYRQGSFVARSDLQPGDVVFFYNTVPGAGISHVGIYVGDNQFIHSPNSRSTVSIASLSNTYWNQHYYGARRMTK